MENFMNLLEQKLMPIALKISSQRHLSAIRQGVVMTLPLTIVGSFFTIFLSLPIDNWGEIIAPYLHIIDTPYRFTVASLSLFATFGIGAALARSYKLDPIIGGMLAVVSFLISTVVPIRVTASMPDVIANGRYINLANLSSTSLFGGIVSALVSGEIYHLCKEKNITIKMPDGVPPEVSNSFAAIIPFLFSIVLFWVIRYIFNIDINGILAQLLMPLKGILTGNSLIGGLLTVFLIHFFWVLGIHGPAIMGPILRPFWDMSIAENMDAFTAGAAATDLPNIFTEQFLQWFVHIGGAGTTLSLVILFMFSRSQYLKSLGRLSILPGVFNINEPVIFGAPIVMNPILAIPFILAPMVTTTIAYIFTQLNLVPLMMAKLAFAFPAPIAAIMSTNWSVMAGVLSVLNIIIGMLIYYPFFKVYEKQQLEKETNQA